jgi:hypothetical protein
LTISRAFVMLAVLGIIVIPILLNSQQEPISTLVTEHGSEPASLATQVADIPLQNLVEEHELDEFELIPVTCVDAGFINDHERSKANGWLQNHPIYLELDALVKQAGNEQWVTDNYYELKRNRTPLGLFQLNLALQHCVAVPDAQLHQKVINRLSEMASNSMNSDFSKRIRTQIDKRHEQQEKCAIIPPEDRDEETVDAYLLEAAMKQDELAALWISLYPTLNQIRLPDYDRAQQLVEILQRSLNKQNASLFTYQIASHLNRVSQSVENRKLAYANFLAFSELYPFSLLPLSESCHSLGALSGGLSTSDEIEAENIAKAILNRVKAKK